MFDKEMTIVVLNALLDEWGNFISSIYGKNELEHYKINCPKWKKEDNKINESHITKEV